MKILKISSDINTLPDQNNDDFNGLDIDRSSDIVCPFCREKDFDLEGLKTHLVHGDCEVYNKVKTVERLF